jgi:ferredoxin-NADP reductase/MOSC domain-containing protein YiiM/ferredoxin
VPHHLTTADFLRRAHLWGGAAEGFAAVAAAEGNPSSLLALEEAKRGASSQPVVGQLLSVNVGMPKDVAWRGRTVFTGVLKESVAGPVHAGKLNLEGDGQGDLAGHGGEQRAVFVYQIDSYRHWQHELGRDDFVYGQFGENFTVDGLGDEEVCIGDRYRIGTATFEVTQPRVTCYRVGLRMNDPRIPALLVSHRRPGFYFRVLQEGHVQAGDEIVKLASGPEQMAVAEVDGLLYLPGRTRQQLLRALRIPALSEGWQESFKALLEAGPDRGNPGLTVTSPPPAWPGFRALAVAAIAHKSDPVIAIRLEDPKGAPLPAAHPGQYLTLRVCPDDRQQSLLRNYSLSGPPDAGYYQIAVKREQHGVVSGYLHSRLVVGDALEIAAPRGTFILDGSNAPVMLISAGIGVTPVLAMLQTLAQARSAREVWWLHGARDGHNHSFAGEARQLLASLTNVHTCVCYSDPGPADRQGCDFDRVGRVTASLLTDLNPPRDAQAYLCGPPSFMDDVSAGLAALGVGGAQIHTELFGPAPGITPGIAPVPTRTPHPPAGEPGTGPNIEFARSNLAIPWSTNYSSLLELAEACDVPVRWSCRTGVCHTCETTLIAGNVDYSPDPVEPPAAGSVLICCSRPQDDLVVDL